MSPITPFYFTMSSLFFRVHQVIRRLLQPTIIIFSHSKRRTKCLSDSSRPADHVDWQPRTHRLCSYIYAAYYLSISNQPFTSTETLFPIFIHFLLLSCLSSNTRDYHYGLHHAGLQTFMSTISNNPLIVLLTVPYCSSFYFIFSSFFLSLFGPNR